jgi:hypothetical protein
VEGVKKKYAFRIFWLDVSIGAGHIGVIATNEGSQIVKIKLLAAALLMVLAVGGIASKAYAWNSCTTTCFGNTCTTNCW